MSHYESDESFFRHYIILILSHVISRWKVTSNNDFPSFASIGITIAILNMYSSPKKADWYRVRRTMYYIFQAVGIFSGNVRYTSRWIGYDSQGNMIYVYAHVRIFTNHSSESDVIYTSVQSSCATNFSVNHFSMICKGRHYCLGKQALNQPDRLSQGITNRHSRNCHRVIFKIII